MITEVQLVCDPGILGDHQAFLYDDDIAVITNVYNSEQDIPGISRRVSKEEILANDGNLNIKLYVDSADAHELADVSIEENLHNYISAHLSAWKEIDVFNNKSGFFAQLYGSRVSVSN